MLLYNVKPDLSRGPISYYAHTNAHSKPGTQILILGRIYWAPKTVLYRTYINSAGEVEEEWAIDHKWSATCRAVRYGGGGG
jgi:hypothetical protein